MPVSDRILFGLTTDLSVNALLAPLLPPLVDDGWDIHIVCSPGRVQVGPVDSSVTVHYLPMSRSISPASDGLALSRWIRLLRRLMPGVVVGGTPKAAMLSMLGARAVRTPVRVFHVRGARWDGMQGRTGRVLRQADTITASAATDVLAVSPSLADLLVKQGVTRDRAFVIGRGGSKGVDTTEFAPSAEPRERPPTIGFMGRLAIDKGLADVLEVFHRCRAVVPGVRLLIIGDLDTAQPVPSRLIAALDTPAVQWLPHTDRPADALRDMDVLVFPSRREGLPNVVIEAAACGIPTVGYDVTGVRDVIDDGVTGALTPPGDVVSMARHTADLLVDDQLRHEQGSAARTLVLEHFERSVVVGGITGWLRERRPTNL